MRKFICSPFGYEVDLDDPETYNYLPKNVEDLRNKMFEEIGYAYCYMNFFHKDIYSKKNKSFGKNCIKQKKRIKLLIKQFTENERENYINNNILWFQEQIYIFQDETENMC
jgi:hypothetical protein